MGTLVCPDKVILFLTDGQPTESRSAYMDPIREKNALLGNEVVILTFGLGSGKRCQVSGLML